MKHYEKQIDEDQPLLLSHSGTGKGRPLEKSPTGSFHFIRGENMGATFRRYDWPGCESHEPTGYSRYRWIRNLDVERLPGNQTRLFQNPAKNQKGSGLKQKKCLNRGIDSGEKVFLTDVFEQRICIGKRKCSLAECLYIKATGIHSCYLIGTHGRFELPVSLNQFARMSVNAVWIPIGKKLLVNCMYLAGVNACEVYIRKADKIIPIPVPESNRVNIGRHSGMAKPGPVNPGFKKWLDRWENLIRENVDDPRFSMSWMAELCGMSVRTMQRRFYKELGISPGAYAKEVKFRMAQEQLMDNPTMSLVQLAGRLNYRDDRYFSMLCKERNLAWEPEA